MFYFRGNQFPNHSMPLRFTLNYAICISHDSFGPIKNLEVTKPPGTRVT
jgi:hypothetical protein